MPPWCAHPHPLFGGTLHNKVVFHTMKALNSFGFPVLRFNFRGTGLSEGEHDHGNGEVDDVRTALDWLDAEYHLPLVFAGFSFGAAVGLRAACPDARVKALIGVGTPVVPVAGGSEEPRVYYLRIPARLCEAQAVRQRSARSVRPASEAGSAGRIGAGAEEAGADRGWRSFLRRTAARTARSD